MRIPKHLWPYMAMAVVCLLLPLRSFGQGSSHRSTTNGPQGTPKGGVAVTVCVSTATVVGNVCTPAESDASCCFTDATLTVRLATPAAPNQNATLVSDGLGNYVFWAAPGLYQVSYSGAGVIPQTIVVQTPCVPTAAACLASGAGNPATPGNSYQLSNGNATNFATGGLSEPASGALSGSTESSKDLATCGPNPYVDARCAGVRALKSSSAIPAVSGITATTTAGQTTVTVSSSSCPSQTGNVCFVNGDGVEIQGAGAANGLGAAGTPTVTPSNAAGPTGTGVGVAAPAGATTYNYTLFGCDIGGGCTAAGASGNTATGNASLGSQSQAGYSGSRSNDTWTYTVGSAPPFSAGAVVSIDTPTSGIADADFEGTYKVATVTGTGFTVTNAPLDTRSSPPARTASLGTFTVHYFNYNKVTWTAVTGSPYRYFVCSDRASPGTFHLLGPALLPVNPLSASFTDGTLEFDDFGATMMAASTGVVPWYLSDANCTGAGTNDNWVTTIASGGGTTTLTMSGNAPNSVAGQPIRFDNTPNLKTAVTSNYTGAKGPAIELPVDPAGGAYVFNSFVDLSANNPTLLLPQGLLSNDTIFFDANSAGAQLYGDRIPGKGSSTQFQSKSSPAITVTASPGLFFSRAFSGVTSGLNVVAPNNGIAVMQDGGGGNLGSTYTDVQFTTGSQSTDYMGIAFVCRGGSGADCRTSFSGKALMFSGTQAMIGLSSTPSIYFDGAATAIFNELMGSARAMVFYGSLTSGAGTLQINHADWQGASTPFITSALKGGTGGGNVQLGRIVLDTVGQPCLANLNAISLSVSIASGCIPSSGFSQITGLRVAGGLSEPLAPASSGQNRDMITTVSGLAYDGIFGSGAAANYTKQQFGPAISTSTSTGIFVEGAQPATPTASVSAGGSVALGTYTFIICPVWWDNSEGTCSPSSASVTTTSGNQTVTVNWAQVAGNPKGYDLYQGTTRQNWNNTTGCGRPQFAGAATIQLVWSSTGSCGNQTVGITSGGPTALLPGVQGIATPALNVAGNAVSASASGLNSSVAVTLSGGSGGLEIGAATSLGLTMDEGTSSTAQNNKDVCWGDGTAHAVKCSFNNGAAAPLTQTIANGTATMTTAAIGAGNCGTTVTVSASGVATTDTITWAFNAAPAGSNAGLVAWPTANNVNFAYCPNSAETPAAATINWRVVR